VETHFVEIDFLFFDVIEFRVNPFGGIRSNISGGLASFGDGVDALLSVEDHGFFALVKSTVGKTFSTRLAPTALFLNSAKVAALGVIADFEVRSFVEVASCRNLSSENLFVAIVVGVELVLFHVNRLRSISVMGLAGSVVVAQG